MDEENFPRGGVVRPVLDKKIKRKNKKEQDLFKDTVDVSSKKAQKRSKHIQKENIVTNAIQPEVLFSKKSKVKKEKNKIKEKKPAKKKKDETGDELIKPEQLSDMYIRESMLLLGYVSEVKDVGLVMALPRGRRGLVPITKISNDYLKCLEKFSGTTDSTNNTEVLHSLADLFKVGSLIPCRVMRGDPTTGLTQLSINPEVINETLTVDSVRKASIIHGCISSCEDTGYIVDLGLSEKKGFLKNKNAVQYIQTHNEGKRLKLGQTVRCRILKKKSKEETFLAVTVDPEQINEPSRKNDNDFADMIPGTRVTATIKHIKDQCGAIVSFNNQIGFVHLSHLPQNLTTYSEGDKIDCCVLYMDTRPGNQSVTLSALPHIVNYTGEPVHLLGFGTLCIGHYLRDATVSHTKAKGVFVKLEGKALGLADLNNIDENTEYKKGTKVRCIVTAIDYEANRVQVSFKQNVIEELVQPSDLVGDMVKGKITSTSKRTDLIVMGKFNGRLTKKQSCQDVTYRSGSTISCRVLSVAKNDVLVLCNKPWAMEPKYPIVTSKDQLELYQTLECYIAHTRREENRVCSYGAIEGLLSKKWTDQEERAQGDPIVCQVMRFDEKKGIIFCSKDSCEEFSVPIEAVGCIIGKSGKTIKSLTKENNIKIQFKEGTCSIYGRKENREKTKKSILELVSRFTNGTGIGSDRKRNNSDKSETEPGSKKQKLSDDSDETISFPRSLNGMVIGTRGWNISMLEKKSGTKLSIKADKNNPELSVCHISGTDEAIVDAKERIKDLLSSFDNEGKPSGKERQDSEGSTSPSKRQRSDSTMSEEGDNEESTKSQKKQKLSETLLIPVSLVGKVIGPRGKTINSLEAETKAKVAIRNDNIDSSSRICFITGSEEAMKAAKARIEMLLGSHDDGVRQEKTPRKAPKADETVVQMRISNADIGKVIGKKGANITKVRYDSGASVSVDCVNEGSEKAWDCVISGTPESTAQAESMIKEYLDVHVSKKTEIVTEELSIPKLFVGKILGKGGKTIDKIRAKSGARVFLKDSELEVDTKVCCISGRVAVVTKAKKIIERRLNPNTKTKDEPKVDKDETEENEDEDEAEADDNDELDSLDSEEEGESDSSVEVTIMVPVSCVEKLLKNTMLKKLQENSPVKIVLTHEDDQEDGLCTITGAEEEVMKTKTKFEKILKKVLEKVSGKKKEVKPSLQLSDSLTWDTDLKLPNQQKNDSSSEDSEGEEVQKPVKKTKAERRKEKNEEEKRIYEYERKKLEGDIVPETADDFDRLVVNSPNSSVVWLRYMAFHLETSEIDKARAVADRALKTISFREEREKLNIWVAYLNLENMYGTNETLGKVLARAIQQCEPLDVYLPLVNMYVESSKIEEAERLYSIMVKKYSANKMVWAKFGEFYFQQNRPESARKLFKRALKSLENRDQVETISKFAQLEFKYGDAETGKVMFENLLSTYPKRTDIWSVYVDLLTKLKDHTVTRGVYNRMINIRLPAKKIKFFFKKYLEFEEKYGNETQIMEVKKKALDYVETGGIKERKEVKAE